MQVPEFDQFSGDYRKIHTKNLAITGVDSLYFAGLKAKIIADEERSHSPGRFLDLGCGDGACIRDLSTLLPQWHFTGIDASAATIALAGENLPSNIELSSGDAGSIDKGDAYFDAVMLASVLHHVPESQQPEVMKEVYRVAKKGARVYIFEHNPWNPLTRYLVRTCVFDKGVKLLTHQKTIKLLVDAGFTVSSKRFMIFFPPGKIAKSLQGLEKALGWLPLGGQYLVTAVK